MGKVCSLILIPDFSCPPEAGEEKSAPSISERALGQIRRESGLLSEVSPLEIAQLFQGLSPGNAPHFSGQILPLHKKVHEKNPRYPAKQLKTPSGFFAAALRANFARAFAQAKFGIIVFILAISISEVLFAEPASIDSEKIGNIPQGERKSPDAWAKIFDSVHGFIEAAYGHKFSGDKLTQKNDYNLLEQRLQLKMAYRPQKPAWLASWNPEFFYKGDFLSDEYKETLRYQIREAYGLVSPLSWMDVKLGRQTLTWGTGDYLFINDVFPKDYESFFIGRDDEYLKKPSDAMKMSFYPSAANVDFIVCAFEPNTIAEGDRLSFFDSFQGGIAGTNSDRDLLEPPLQPSNLEYALRIYRNLGSHEAAFYYFRGFDKNPNSYKDEAARQLSYPRLDVYGGSLRGPVASGIGNIEFGYYNSREDSDGKDRLIENSMAKVLTGYEKDMGNDFTIGFQYLYEQTLNYDNYSANLLPTDFVFDEFRHLLTQRITKLFKNQTVTVSLFNFYSPSDKDGYVRPTISYNITDQWKATLGANLPWGEDNITEFGQMKRNKNVFVRLRCSF